MEIIFTIIGFIILGTIVRSLMNDKSIEDKPQNSSQWIFQLVICLIVGAIVWAMMPNACKHRSSSDYDYSTHGRLSRD